MTAVHFFKRCEMEEKSQSCGCAPKCKIVALFVLAAGIALGGFFPGWFYYRAHVNSNFVTVKGLAERQVQADLAVWTMKFVATGNNLSAVQKNIDANRALIHAFLEQKGFEAFEISDGRVETNDLQANPYRSDAISVRYILQQAVTVRSQKVFVVEKALGETGELIEKGVVFDSQSYGSPVSYIFTKLNEIKPEMLEQATKNATAAAEEFAKSSHSKVGKIRRAQQGVFSILPALDDNNAQESWQIGKKVRVVSTVEFRLD